MKERKFSIDVIKDLVKLSTETKANKHAAYNIKCVEKFLNK